MKFSDSVDHDVDAIDDAWSALETNWGAGAVGKGCHKREKLL